MVLLHRRFLDPMLWLKAVALGLVLVGYPTVMHLLLTSGQWPISTLLFGLLPLSLVPLALFKSGQILWGLLVTVVLTLVVAFFWMALLQRQEWIYLIQNVGMQALMAWVFGRTLFPPHEALISQFARRIHGPDFTPVMATYTRRVTLAWVIFFALMALISIFLFTAASVEAWSFFVNLLYLPLLVAMFVVEYAVRLYCLRGVHHVSIVKGVAAYWEKQTPADEKN